MALRMTANTWAQSSGAFTSPALLLPAKKEIDDECSLTRFCCIPMNGMLMVSLHWVRISLTWAQVADDNCAQPLPGSIRKSMTELVKQDKRYSTAAFLQERTLQGNVETEGVLNSDQL